LGKVTKKIEYCFKLLFLISREAPGTHCGTRHSLSYSESQRLVAF